MFTALSGCYTALAPLQWALHDVVAPWLWRKRLCGIIFCVVARSGGGATSLSGRAPRGCGPTVV